MILGDWFAKAVTILDILVLVHIKVGENNVRHPSTSAIDVLSINNYVSESEASYRP